MTEDAKASFTLAIEKYGETLVMLWLKNAEDKYLKLKEKAAKPRKPSANKALANFSEADFEKLKKLVS